MSLLITINEISYEYYVDKDIHKDNLFYKMYEIYLKKEFLVDNVLIIKHNNSFVKNELIQKIFDFLYNDKLSYDKKEFFTKEIYDFAELFVASDYLMLSKLKANVIDVIKTECEQNISYKDSIDFLMKMNFNNLETGDYLIVNADINKKYASYSPTKEENNFYIFGSEYRKYFINDNEIDSKKTLSEFTYKNLIDIADKNIGGKNTLTFSHPMMFYDTINGIQYYLPFEFMNKTNIKKIFNSYVKCSEKRDDKYSSGFVELSCFDNTLCDVLCKIASHNRLFANEILKYDTPYHILKFLSDFISFVAFDDSSFESMMKRYESYELESDINIKSKKYYSSLKETYIKKYTCKQYMFCDNLISFSLFSVFNDPTLLKFVEISNHDEYQLLLSLYPDNKLIIENKKYSNYDNDYIVNGFNKMTKEFNELFVFKNTNEKIKNMKQIENVKELYDWKGFYKGLATVYRYYYS